MKKIENYNYAKKLEKPIHLTRGRKGTEPCTMLEQNTGKPRHPEGQTHA
jgi:hypothetical protein